MNVLSDLDPAAVLACALPALAAAGGVVLTSGYLPWSERPEGLRGPLAPVLVAGCVAVTGALALAALWAAAALPLAVAVVVIGSAILIAPFLVQPLPAGLRDSRLGAGLFLALGVVLLAALPLPLPSALV